MCVCVCACGRGGCKGLTYVCYSTSVRCCSFHLRALTNAFFNDTVPLFYAVFSRFPVLLQCAPLVFVTPFSCTKLHGKSKAIPVQATKAYAEAEVLTPLFLKLDTTDLFPEVRVPEHTEHGAGWNPESV